MPYKTLQNCWFILPILSVTSCAVGYSDIPTEINSTALQSSITSNDTIKVITNEQDKRGDKATQLIDITIKKLSELGFHVVQDETKETTLVAKVSGGINHDKPIEHVVVPIYTQECIPQYNPPDATHKESYWDQKCDYVYQGDAHYYLVTSFYHLKIDRMLNTNTSKTIFETTSSYTDNSTGVSEYMNKNRYPLMINAAFEAFPQGGHKTAYYMWTNTSVAWLKTRKDEMPVKIIDTP